MLDKKAYNDYLSEKVKSQKQIEERLKFFDAFNQAVIQNDLKSVSDVTEKEIDCFITSFRKVLVELQKAFDFLSDYVLFIKAEQPELNAVAAAIESYCLKQFENSAKKAAASRKKTIFLIPDDVKIDPKHLAELTNKQFITAFKELQQLMIKVYEDIEKSPFDWGYPDYYITDGYYNRVFDFLYAFVCCGDFSNDILTVDTKKFFAFASVKRHKKSELMIAGFEKCGFVFDGYGKDLISFKITYPSNSHMTAVLCGYIQSFKENALHWSSAEMMKWSFSYRFVEDASTQKFETVFHSKLDLASDELRKIQYWLHDEAAKHGFKIDVLHPYEKNCIQYKKGSKIFLLVGEKDIKGVPTVFSKVIFRDAFVKEKEKIMELYNKFPDTFKSNCRMCRNNCNMRICYEIEGNTHKNCAYNSFYFYNLTLDNVKELLELYIIENKIK